jgi:hypothetical protein
MAKAKVCEVCRARPQNKFLQRWRRNYELP